MSIEITLHGDIPCASRGGCPHRTCAGTGRTLPRRTFIASAIQLISAGALLLPGLGAPAAVIFTNLVNFNITNGASPVAALVQGSDGWLYGTASYGGVYTNIDMTRPGTVFKMDTNGTLITLHSFGQYMDTNEDFYSLDGADPECTLVEFSDGCFYGTTSWAGTNLAGQSSKSARMGR